MMSNPKYITLGHKANIHLLMGKTLGEIYATSDELEVYYLKMFVEKDPFMEKVSPHILEKLATKLEYIIRDKDGVDLEYLRHEKLYVSKHQVYRRVYVEKEVRIKLISNWSDGKEERDQSNR